MNNLFKKRVKGRSMLQSERNEIMRECWEEAKIRYP